MSHAPTTVESRGAPAGAQSVYSFHSGRDLSQFLQERNGRGFNTVNEKYWLPADETEWNRLDKQNSTFLAAMGGPYPCPEIIEPILTPSGTTPKLILDVGCGSGAWSIEMAHLWPEALVKGIDLAPVRTDPDLFPNNLDFEVDDINLPLNHLYDQYDLIHWRLVQGGIKDIPKTITELQRCLKPGGVLLVIESDIENTGSDWKKAPLAKIDGDPDVSGVSEKGSWFLRMLWEAVEALEAGKADRDTAFFDRGFWNHPLMDPATCGTGSLFIPIGPWASSPNVADNQLLKYVGVLMRQNCSNVHYAYHPVLRRVGVPQAILDEWSKRTQEEFDTMSMPTSTRFSLSWGRRRAGENLPAPPLPPYPTPNTPDPRPPRLPHPFFEIFHTQEESMEARRKRRDSLGEPAPLLVRRIAKAAEQTQSP